MNFDLSKFNDEQLIKKHYDLSIILLHDEIRLKTMRRAVKQFEREIVKRSNCEEATR